MRSAVPARDPLTALFAMRPVITATSSMLYPSAPATEEELLNVSPMMEILVLELAAAAASTSAKCAVSDAFSPKADRLSVTISDTCARSSPAAAARLITPSMPFSISRASQPAIAIYSIALALCCAVNLVVAPSSFASAVSAAISDVLELAIASTADIACPKFPATSTHSM